ncbi:MerR family transcriptional regulator [Virgibacillus sp. LDC-1]|uniref:MerR family transcriptional regulator n=1 Tax=Virgibacillus sp. LDC-1 TaxID=3039856 RepID=UPI0024DE4F77|nr:MerR family transcriptional regulator [Virgibacillus sp. LDC-1]
MKVKEVAELTGISVRTLHHYDDIGLLSPQKMPGSGYRLYETKDLEKLQQILFFRELDFPLRQIKEIMMSPLYDHEEALRVQRKMLIDKRKRIDQMITTINQTIQCEEGEIEMTDKERFAGIDFRHNPYEEEARQRWGDTAVEQSKKKIASMGEEEQQEMAQAFDAIYKKLATVRDEPADSEKAQAYIEEWFLYLNQLGSYSLEAFKGLGQMYVDDPRFTKNIDKYGDGLAEFMKNAMAVYAERNQR